MTTQASSGACFERSSKGIQGKGGLMQAACRPSTMACRIVQTDRKDSKSRNYERREKKQIWGKKWELLYALHMNRAMRCCSENLAVVKYTSYVAQSCVAAANKVS